MIALAWFAAALAILAAGAGFGVFAFGGRAPAPTRAVERLLIGLLAGLGVWSAGYGAFLLLGWISPLSLFLKDVLLIVIGAAAVLAFKGDGPRPSSDPSLWAQLRRSPATVAAVVAALAVFTATMAFNLMYMLKYIPDGGWDAWAIWNLRARFLFLSMGDLHLATSQDLSWSHPDYPLMLPGLLANCWTLMGAAAPSAGAVVSLVFMGLCVLILAAAATTAQGVRAGMTGALMLAGTPAFLEMGRRQMADIPLAAFALAAVVLAGQASASARPLPLWASAGLMMSFAAWTKNEGLLHLLALGLAIMGAGVAGSGPRGRAYSTLSYLLGAAPGLLLLLSFKLVINSGNDLVSAFAINDGLAHAMDLDRAEKLLALAGEILFADLSEWAGLTIVVPFVIAANLTRIAASPQIRVVGLHAGLWFAGFLLVYLCTPRDMAWHLRTSAARVFMQCWPTLIFLALLAGPREATAPRSDSALPASP